MKQTQICLTLTGKTLKEDLEILEKYRPYVDMVELRGDFLQDDENLYMRNFPRLAGIPCILTIRRKIDGGKFDEGEAARTILFARALSFADVENHSSNFQYVDFEDDFSIPSLQDATLAFGTKIIRSSHDMFNPVYNLAERLENMKQSPYEIPKIAFMPHSLDDVTNMFVEAEKLKDRNHILIAMGPLGGPSRILSHKLKNFLTFVSPADIESNLHTLGHLDPIELNDLYHFKNINEDTGIYGITGWPLKKSKSPELHNKGFVKKNINSVYLQVRSEEIKQTINFANQIGMKGFSVTIPHKESVIEYLDEITDQVKKIGACNTVVKKNGKLIGHNTDAYGFEKSLLDFLGVKNLARRKVAIIGAGGAAKAIAYSVKQLKGRACIFNRTESRAKELAEKYGFEYSILNETCLKKLKKYNDIIIQTTSKGMNSTELSNSENDPLYFYEFTGKEIIYDVVYVPEITPIMNRAQKKGCKVCNGYEMLKHQGYKQFELYTGESYD